MDQDKPFKTIEVIDHDTKQTCKIACMSCIRGHRTTSCGIPVCRTKIFWTVKRPGRPSNSCTCRFNSSGVCKCVTAIPKCPHKSKKGEKRSAECRCDEQGRFCCLLEPIHWEILFNAQKPIVQFFPNRDALETWQVSQSVTPQVSTPAAGGCCGSRNDAAQSLNTPRMSRSIAPSPGESTFATPQTLPIIPRFGFMGTGAPMGSNGSIAPDVMVWTDEASTAYSPMTHLEPLEEPASCCGRSMPTRSQDDMNAALSPAGLYDASFDQTFPALSPFDRFFQDYQTYQFPNAICQNCGLNGCTCRSCPPLMQNFGTTSWAQSCGRRHARIAPAPPPSVSQAQQYSAAPLTQLEPDIKPQFLPEDHSFISMPDIMNDIQNHDHLSPISQNSPYRTNDPVIMDDFAESSDLLPHDMTEPLNFPVYTGHLLESLDQSDQRMYGG